MREVFDGYNNTRIQYIVDRVLNTRKKYHLAITTRHDRTQDLLKPAEVLRVA